MKNLLIIIFILLMCSPVHASKKDNYIQKKASKVIYKYDVHGNLIGKDYILDKSKKRKLTKKQKQRRKRNIQKATKNRKRIMPKYWRSKR